jgi:2'-phosphotransferase
LPEVKEVVSSNDKQRFSLIHKSTHALSADSSMTIAPEDDDDPANYLICANQGHSIKIASVESMHTPITLETPESLPKIVVHGTTRKAWPQILRSGGLKRMGRNHVHFAIGLPKGFESAAVDDTVEEIDDAPKSEVVSGMRNSSSVLIYLDLPKALESGLLFYISKNGVVLGDGGEAGLIPVSLFKSVEERGGNIIVKDGEIVGTLSRT